MSEGKLLVLHVMGSSSLQSGLIVGGAIVDVKLSVSGDFSVASSIKGGRVVYTVVIEVVNVVVIWSVVYS